MNHCKTSTTYRTFNAININKENAFKSLTMRTFLCRFGQILKLIHSISNKRMIRRRLYYTISTHLFIFHTIEYNAMANNNHLRIEQR